MSGKLTLVPTPIGNLEDMTFRAIKVLKEADSVLAEDTRTSGFLLKHFEVTAKLSAFHLHNEHLMTPKLVERLKEGENIALVSDAGTPGISDPGFLLVRAAVQNNIEVDCLPGATAFVPALVVSGFPSDRFVYEGFLPLKKGRQTRIMELAEEKRTVVLYESPHRIGKCLAQLAEFFGEDREAVVVREISKKFESKHRGTLKELHELSSQIEMKGEIAVVIKGKD